MTTNDELKKICSSETCEQKDIEQSINNFYKKSGGKLGVDYFCKKCRNTHNKAKNPDKYQKQKARWLAIPDIDTIKCSTCKVKKVKSEFHHGSWICKSCASDMMKRKRKEDPETQNGYSAKYRKNNVEKRKETVKRSRENNPQTSLKNYVKKYGLTVEQYEKMVVEQDNKCYICRKAETKKRKGKVNRLSIDHCHKTKKVRGLVCHSCNYKIGVFEDAGKMFRISMYLAKIEYSYFSSIIPNWKPIHLKLIDHDDEISVRQVLRKDYNMTLETYNEMYNKQKGLCAMCGKPEKSKAGRRISRLSVDHCHKTGKIRALLCVRCNLVLGSYEYCIENNLDVQIQNYVDKFSKVHKVAEVINV